MWLKQNIVAYVGDEGSGAVLQICDELYVFRLAVGSMTLNMDDGGVRVLQWLGVL